ncbi:tyrosine-type recombinase/integrase [uncultured Nitratireductor sp.]|uniref:tyrosine-type recombinase/integrase n=1 Tax=uncultured Nitratireductor sp. TaxID=520953 RepID=UPI0026337CDD|nr:tyrosine-type recombinase/integrase [uncultured Nitratireductor sp.]
MDTKAKRAKLEESRKPYFERLSPGVFLGYRKQKKARKWVVRFADPKALKGSTNPYRVETFAASDDGEAVADGVNILDYATAKRRASEIAAQRGVELAADVTPVTVRQACEDHIAVKRRHEFQRSGRDKRPSADYRLQHVLRDTKLADTLISDLTERHLKDWVAGLTFNAGATHQRVIADFRTALNAAAPDDDFRKIVKAGLVSDKSRRPVKARRLHLSSEQIAQLLQAAKDEDEDLHKMLAVLAATGLRFGQVMRLRVGDLERSGDDWVLNVPASFKGKKPTEQRDPIVRFISDSLAELLADDRPEDAPLLERWRHVEKAGPTRWVRDARGPWTSAAELTRPWKRLCERVGLSSEHTPYSLRHSSIIRHLTALAPVHLVAKIHDTSAEMIERNYASSIRDAMKQLEKSQILEV